MADVSRTILSTDEMLPAPGQGALAIEVRSDAPSIHESAALLDHLPTRLAVTAERTVLANLNGGCLAPIAAHATVNDETLHLKVIVLSIDGSERVTESRSAELPEETTDPAEHIQKSLNLAQQVTDSLIEQGALEILKSVR